VTATPAAPYVLARPGPDDAARLADLAATAFRETYLAANDPDVIEEHVATAHSTEAFALALADERCELHWLLRHGDPVGYLKLNLAGAQTEPGLDDGLEVEQVYLLDAHQGHGLGRTLVEVALDAARRHGLTNVWLGVWEANGKAIGFYRSQGFEVFGAHTFRLGDEEQRDLLMRRPVTYVQ
jgi:ribosomal protein S18 acetylase RimI-like enzyme